MNLRPLRFEDFDRSAAAIAAARRGGTLDDEEVRLARIRAQSHAAGVEEGRATAQAAFDEALAAQLRGIDAAIDELRAAEAERAAGAVETMGEIFNRFLDAMGPTIAEGRLGDDLRAALDAALATAQGPRLTIEIGTEREAEIAERFSSRGDEVEIKVDPTLGPGEARVRWRGGFDQIDSLDAVHRATELLTARLAAASATPRKGDEA